MSLGRAGGGHSHGSRPRSVGAPSTKATGKAPSVGLVVTIPAGDARTADGRGERREPRGFLSGPHPPHWPTPVRRALL